MLAGPRPSVAGGRAEHESERRPWGRGPRCVANQTWVATCGRALPAGEGHPAFTRTERLGASPHSRRRGPPVGSSAGEFLSGGKGDLTFPQVEGLDARGIALASPTPAARLRDNPARLARGEGSAHISARPQKVGMAFLVLHFDTNNNAYICMLQRNPYVAEGLWGPAWDHVRGTSRQIACNLAVGTASKVDCKTLCSPHLL